MQHQIEYFFTIMKRALFLLCVLCGLQSLAIAEALPQATKWYGVQYVHYPSHNEQLSYIHSISYTLSGDTTINSKIYSQLLLTNKDEKLDAVYRGALRISSNRQQVYFIPSGQIDGAPITKEYLLYDFDVQVGDVVQAYSGFNDASCLELEKQGGYAVVQDWTVADVKVIDGRKHVKVTNKDNISNEWIEGVGTKYILWAVGRYCYATGEEKRMQRTLCVQDNMGNTLYSFNTEDLGIRNNCPDYWEVIDSAIDKVVKQPASATKLLRDGQLFIKRDGKTYSVTGQEVK